MDRYRRRGVEGELHEERTNAQQWWGGGTSVAMGIVPPQRISFASALSIYAETYLVHGISSPLEIRTPCIYAVILYVTIYCSVSTEEKPK